MFSSIHSLKMEVPVLATYRKLKRGGSTHESEEVGEKKVVLFGRNGEDKTNVARALVTGGLGSAAFKLDNDGHSIVVKTERGRGWSITNTVEGLSLENAQAKSRSETIEIVMNFLKNLKGEYSHIIYTQPAVMASSTVDHLIWLAYEQIFAGAEEAYVVLYTGGDEKWLDTHWNMQPDYLKQATVLVTDICPISTRRVREKRQAVLREKEIEKLEKELQEMFDKKKQKYFRPLINDMDDDKLRQKAEALLNFLAERIQSTLHPNLWMKVASKFSEFFPLVWYFRELEAMKSNAAAPT